MSYTDRSNRSSPASIAAVVGVHLAIGYALISGLAYQVFKHAPTITVAEILPADPPPPQPHPIAPAKARTAAQPVVDPQPQHQDRLSEDAIIRAMPPIDLGGSGGGSSILPPVDPPKVSQAHDAIAGSDRLHWITTEDYPAAALRQNMAGIVGISAMIGVDGRVRSCIVTQSSGSQLLDDTTCRLYAKRGHFTPARDADGNPIAAQRSDRFRWQIPD